MVMKIRDSDLHAERQERQPKQPRTERRDGHLSPSILPEPELD
jgi:hypothetical protein